MVPEKVIFAVLNWCKTKNINPRETPNKITQSFLKEALKMTNYARFYENMMQIRVRITGVQARRFTTEERYTLMKIFRELQGPFERHKGDRKNFLSYSFVMHKICQLLGITEVLKYLPVLTLPANKMATDTIWRKMCADLGYEYIGTR